MSYVLTLPTCKVFFKLGVRLHKYKNRLYQRKMGTYKSNSLQKENISQ